MGKVTYVKIPTAEELRRNGNHKNCIWMRGGLIALGILFGVNLIFLFLAAVLGEEARLAFRAIATFPALQIINIFFDIALAESWAVSFGFLIINSFIYFGVGALIGCIVKKIEER